MKFKGGGTQASWYLQVLCKGGLLLSSIKYASKAPHGTANKWQALNSRKLRPGGTGMRATEGPWRKASTEEMLSSDYGFKGLVGKLVTRNRTMTLTLP